MQVREHHQGVDPEGPAWIVEVPAGTTAEALAGWVTEHHDAIEARLLNHGAVVMRGAAVDTPERFEAVASAAIPDLEEEYLGTSPRAGRTRRVFNASELPGYYPIPQHCEMTFIANPPRRIVFGCLVAPATGGETPLVDFRAVLAQMDPAVRERFERGGVRIIRNYEGPSSTGRDLWKMKRWDEMFGSTDRDEVERKARAEGFEPSWRDGDRLRLISDHQAVHAHPDSGVPVWFNHSQVFHLSAAPGEYRRILAMRPGPRNLALWAFANLMVAAKRRFVRTEDQALHCTHVDGTEIADADMEHVRDLIWKNMVLLPWRQGDVVLLDNRSVSHGRLPYKGPREVVVGWS